MFVFVGGTPSMKEVMNCTDLKQQKLLISVSVREILTKPQATNNNKTQKGDAFNRKMDI